MNRRIARKIVKQRRASVGRQNYAARRLGIRWRAVLLHYERFVGMKSVLAATPASPA